MFSHSQYPIMLRKVSRQLNANLIILRERLTVKAIQKSPGDVPFEFTCTCVGVATVPFSPVVGPGGGDCGELGEVPFGDPKTALQHPWRLR